jgi:hypothetical protein
LLLRHHDRFAPAADYSDRAEDIQSAFTPINVLLGNDSVRGRARAAELINATRRSSENDRQSVVVRSVNSLRMLHAAVRAVWNRIARFTIGKTVAVMP